MDEQKTKLSFGQAIEALKTGKMLSREAWSAGEQSYIHGRVPFVFMQVSSVIFSSVVPNMQSLPDSVKKELQMRFKQDPENNFIKYREQFAKVFPDNVITGWSPSIADVLNNDWCILD